MPARSRLPWLVVATLVAGAALGQVPRPARDADRHPDDFLVPPTSVFPLAYVVLRECRADPPTPQAGQSVAYFVRDRWHHNVLTRHFRRLPARPGVQPRAERASPSAQVYNQ